MLSGALLLAAASGFQGYRMGAAQNEARHVIEVRKAADRADQLERDRLAAEKKASLLSQALEDQAYAQPAQSSLCLPAGRVLRLNQR